eukprot:comp20051_c0_seq1/m.24638 comp20051_c0_seq1/g.24638  ORF comp20051_c0_seq1/g.24638 comp20051_c0_seq1/m.24638 type:complete len:902 (-) comp20051_c0_seq1:414-3119(-)
MKMASFARIFSHLYRGTVTTHKLHPFMFWISSSCNPISFRGIHHTRTLLQENSGKKSTSNTQNPTQENRIQHDKSPLSRENSLFSKAKTPQDVKKILSYNQKLWPYDFVSALLTMAKHTNEDRRNLQEYAKDKTLGFVVHNVMTNMNRLEPHQLAHALRALSRLDITRTCPSIDHSFLRYIALKATIKAAPHLNPKGLSLMVSAYATSKWSKPTALEALEWRALELLPQFSANEMSHLAWGFASLGFNVTELLMKMEPMLVEKLKNSLGQTANTSTAPTTGMIFSQSESRDADAITPLTLSLALWAYASANHMAPTLFLQSEQWVLDLMPSFKPQDVTKVVWAYAKANHPSRKILDAATARITNEMDSFSTTDLSMLLWAFAKQWPGEADVNMVQEVMTSLVKRERDVSPIGMQTLAWAAACFKDRIDSYPVLAVVDRHAARVLPQLNPALRGQLAWAYGETRYPASNIIPVSEELFRSNIEKRRPNHLIHPDDLPSPRVRSNPYAIQPVVEIAWAAARLRQSAPAAIQYLVDSIQSNAGEFQPRNLSMAVEALSLAGRTQPVLLKAITEIADKRLDDYQPKDLTGLVRGLALAGYFVPELCDGIAEQAALQVNNMDPPSLSIIARSLSELGRPGRKFLSAIEGKFAQRGAEAHFDSLAATNLAWALAAGGHVPITRKSDGSDQIGTDQQIGSQGLVVTEQDIDPFFGIAGSCLIKHVAVLGEPKTLTKDFLRRLYEADLAIAAGRVGADPITMGGLGSDLYESNPELYEKARGIFEEAQANTGPKHPMAHDVGGYLDRIIGNPVQRDAKICGGYTVEYAIPSMKIAVEFWGPNRYTKPLDPWGETNEQVGNLLGSEWLRKRNLEAMGWFLVGIPPKQWDDLPSPDDRVRFLKLAMGLPLN